MAAKVTLISTIDSEQLTLYAVDAKELLANNPTDWKVFNPAAPEKVAEAAQAAQAVEESVTPKLDPSKMKKPAAIKAAAAE